MTADTPAATSALPAETARRGLLFVFVTLFLDVIGIAIVLPVLPAFLRELTGADLSHAAVDGGWLMFVYSAMQFLFAPLIGNLSDRFGRRPVLLFSVGTFALDNLICALAPSLAWLFLGRVLAGISGGSFSAASAFIADVSNEQNRARNFGVIGMAFGTGFVLGPVIGGVLGEFGPRVPFFGAAAVTGLNFLFGLMLLPETLPKERRRAFSFARANPLGMLRQMRTYPGILWLGLAFFLFQLAGMTHPAIFAFVTQYRYGWSERDIGLALGLVGVCGVLVMGLLLPRIIGRLGERRTALIGLTIGIFGYLGYALAPQGWMFYGVIVASCLVGLSDPSIRSIAVARVPANAQGELQGALTSLFSLTSILAPLIATQLFAFFTGPALSVPLPGAPYAAAALMQVVALAVFYFAVRPRPSH